MNGSTQGKSMATIYTIEDGDLSVLESRVVSILGYGNQGRAQAQNLRDSGVQVVVGNRRDASFDQAIADGMDAYEISVAVQRADCHFLLVPDEIMPQLFEEEVRPHLQAGQALVLASGYNVSYGFLDYPADVDLLLIAPRMIGTGVRRVGSFSTAFPTRARAPADIGRSR